MKGPVILLLAAVVAVLLSSTERGTSSAVAQTASEPAPVTVLVEAEAFQFHGDWLPGRDYRASGGGILRTFVGAEADAVTAIALPRAGRYHVWLRARDFADIEPGARRFHLAINGERLPEDAGDHGHEGYRWQKAGERDLDAGRHMLALQDTTQDYVRCDAVLLTTDASLDPNTLTRSAIARLAIEPVEVEGTTVPPYDVPPPVDDATLAEVAELTNEHLRVTFHVGRDVAGAPRVASTMEVSIAGAWHEVPMSPDQQHVLLFRSSDSGISTTTITPTWADSHGEIRIELGGRTFTTRTGRNNPFHAGSAEVLAPVACEVIDERTVQVTYRGASGATATGRWHLAPGRRDVAFSLTFTADEAGEYSIGYTGFRSWSEDEVEFVQLPPLHQFQRLPNAPVMITSAMTSHPLVMVQAPFEGVSSPMTCALIAEPGHLRWEWSNRDNADYGFGLLNAAGRVQPTIFEPVLGLDRSRLGAGEEKTVAWRLLLMPGDWTDALAYAVTEIMGVTDYREPIGTSLGDAAMNLIDLVGDDFASGWDANLKGFYNIESRGTATQAAPLAVLSAAMLTQDEALWAERAMPSIAFSLTRPGAHFATEVPDTYPSYVNEAYTRLSVPSNFFGTAYWQGVHALLGEKNRWIADDIALDEGRPRHRTPSNVAMPRWSEMLAAWRLDPSEERLREVTAEADAWLRRAVYGRDTEVRGINLFYNIQFYPYWWDLIDLYEITGERRYLDAAEQGAFHTMAGLWSFPQPPAGSVTIHEGDRFVGTSYHLWWRGDEQFRLGHPLEPGDVLEKQVPGWQVARVGLGLEQPTTYFATGRHAANGQILLANWAPHLLRVHQHTGRDVYRTFARNTIIGRFANYPGYYVRGYTDLYLQPRYPYEGPDVTSLYYHHIPPHLAMTLDYLFTQAEQRSGGRIRFPWVKQQGYVWFVNRIFGRPGQVFGDTPARPMLSRHAVRPDHEAISVLMARSPQRVWVVLMNDAHEDVTTTVTFDASDRAMAGVRLDGEATLHDASGDAQPLTLDGAAAARVTVPALGLVALALPAEAVSNDRLDPASTQPPVRDGYVTQVLPGAWREATAFRIRSPFGRDGLYVALMGRPAGDAAAELLIDGHVVGRDTTYPYEFTVYPLPIDASLTCTLRLKVGDEPVVASEPWTMPGAEEDTGARGAVVDGGGAATGACLQRRPREPVAAMCRAQAGSLAWPAPGVAYVRCTTVPPCR